MTDTPPVAIATVAVSPSKVTWKDWTPVIALLITVGAIIGAGGKYTGQIDENTRRIVALETDAHQRDEKLNQIDLRAERIETKLDLLLTGRLPADRAR